MGWRAGLNTTIIIISMTFVHYACASNDKLGSLSRGDLQSALTFGPWPPPISRDASNRVSGQPQAIALGERLFFNPRLSGGADYFAQVAMLHGATGQTAGRVRLALRLWKEIHRHWRMFGYIAGSVGMVPTTHCGGRVSGRC